MKRTRNTLTNCTLLALMLICLPVAGDDRWSGDSYAKSHSVQHQWAGHLLGAYAFLGNEQVLDIGCGDGSFTAEIATAVPWGSILGLDLSPNMIAHAQETYYPIENLAFVEGNAADLHFAEEFDLVTCFTCLHWVKDQHAALTGVYRSLKPGGRVLITCPMEGMLTEAIARTRNSNRWNTYFEGYVPKTTFYTPEAYENLLGMAGFIDRNVEGHLTITWMDSPTDVGRWMAQWLDEKHQVPEAEREEFVADIVTHYLTNQVCSEGKVGVRLEVFMASAVKAS